MNKQDILRSLGYTKGIDFPNFDTVQTVPMSAEVYTEKLEWIVYNRVDDVVAVIQHVDHESTQVLMRFSFSNSGNQIEMNDKLVKSKVGTDEMLRRWNETRAMDIEEELSFSI